MKKVNVFIIGFIFILLSGVVSAQTPVTTDYFVGDWEVVVVGTPNGDASMMMHLERVDGKLQGSFSNEYGELKIDSIEEKETSITLFFVIESYDLSLLLEKVDDNNVKGNMVDQFDATGKRVVK